MIRKKIIFIMTLALIIGYGCEESVLDKDPRSSFTEGPIYTDINLTERLVFQSYNSTDQWGIKQNDWWGQIIDIDAGCDETWFHWTPAKFPNNFGLLGPDEMGFFSGKWATKYSFIRDINDFLNKIDDAPVFETNPAEVEILKGEMKFLRASLYTDLINYWGGVPIITEPFGLQDDFELTRDSYQACVEFIVNELDEAVEMVPETRPDSEFGRVTKGACLALKSRILLYAASRLHDPDTEPNGPLYDYVNPNKWQEASDAAKAVLDMEMYKLVEVQDWREYQAIFIQPTEELIFARPYHPEYGRINKLPDKMHSPNGYNGWGGSNPTQNLVWAYEMDNGMMIDEPGSGYDPNNPYVDRDPRFYATIIYDGAMYRGRPAEYFHPGGLDSRDGIMDFHYALTGYNMRKFMDESRDFDSERGSRPFILFRLGEIYLNYAEAQYHLGNEDVAREYVNYIRSRVGMPDITTSGEDLLDDIKHERRIELVFENPHRFFDVRRWMDGEVFDEDCMGIEWNKLDGDGNLSPDGTLTPTIITVEERRFVPKNYYLPIPMSEINKTNLQQNWGYD